jgi:GTP cyclohydrolase I
MSCGLEIISENKNDIQPQTKKECIPSSPYSANGLSDEEKIKKIADHFANILETIGLDLEDDSLRNTPLRYATMLVEELFSGLKQENFPNITTQKNTFGYKEMFLQTNIAIKSMCEHHFVPFVGSCHIAYFPRDKVIGLSKLSRIARYFAKRPQIQERMTKQIRTCLSSILETEDVAVAIDACHFCVIMRGVEDADTITRSFDFGGKFLNPEIRKEFLLAIPAVKSAGFSNH